MVKLSLPHPIPITNPTSPFRNFNFMRPIKIVGSDTDLHDYQVRIHLDRSNFPLEKCKPDGSDIRFRDDSGEILPYWIERWNAAEGVVWCKIPFIPAESSKFIWMIYGNPNAKSESNGNAVFELFDVQDIVGFWHFDELQWAGITGEVKDETGVNHGTAYGGATTTSDAVYGRAGSFDGEDDYVRVLDNDSLDITGDLTIEAWFNCHDATTAYWGRTIIRKQYNYVLAVKDSGNGPYVKFYLWGLDHNSGSCISGFFSLYEWVHVVATYDGSKMRVYLDGELSGTLNYDDTLRVSSYDLEIAYHRADSYWFDGLIDELRIYKRALSPTEVQILYNNYMQKMGSYFNVRKYVTPAPVVIV